MTGVGECDQGRISARGGPNPLAGLRVIEFSHMVMGPTCGMVLADLGADVVKVEPAPGGDNTRNLTGPAVGFFPAFNRNKRSLCIDLKSQGGVEAAQSLVGRADVLIENFRPGAMAKLGLDYESVSKLNSSLVYCSCKGFLPGPYDNRVALDEVVQMMGGLAYMTGPPGRPLRAGASVNDIMGGVFGVVAILAALREREKTGRGGLVQSGLFETNVLFVAQHMSRAAIEGRDPPSMADPSATKPWPLYDVFETAEPDAHVFVGVVTQSQWRDFCRAFDFEDLLQDPELSSMEQLARARPRILKRVAPAFRSSPQDELMARLEILGLPFAPIAKPRDLFDDPHLLASGGLLPVDLPGAHRDGNSKQHGLPALPITLPGGRPGLMRQPPELGEHSWQVLMEAGASEEQIARWIDEGVLVAVPDNEA